MALTRTKVWIAGEVLTASDLNAEFNGILNNALTLISPLTGTLDLDGNQLTLDGDADLNLVPTADDVLALRIGSTSLVVWNLATASAVNGVTITASATGNAVQIASTGSDSDIALNLVTAGTGALQWDGTAFGTVFSRDTGTGTTNVPLVSDILGKQTIPIPADAMKYDSAGTPPSPFTVRFASAPYISGLSFTNASVTEAFFDFPAPKDYNGGAIDVQAVYFHQGGQTAGLDGVVWQIGLLSRADDESLATPFTSTTVTKDDSSSNVPLFTSTGTVTPNTASANAAEWIFGRVARLTTDASDDMDIAAILMGVILKYTANALNDS